MRTCVLPCKPLWPLLCCVSWRYGNSSQARRSLVCKSLSASSFRFAILDRAAGEYGFAPSSVQVLGYTQAVRFCSWSCGGSLRSYRMCRTSRRGGCVGLGDGGISLPHLSVVPVPFHCSHSSRSLFSWINLDKVFDYSCAPTMGTLRSYTATWLCVLWPENFCLSPSQSLMLLALMS